MNTHIVARGARFDAKARRSPAILLALTLGALLASLSAVSNGTAAEHDSYDGGPDYERYGPQDGEWEFSLSGTGGNDNNFNGGSFGVAGSLGYFLTDGFEVGARHNMAFFDTDETNSTFAATTRIFADYHFDLDRFQPFLGVNLGIRYGSGGVDETGTAAPEVGLKFFALENTYLLAMGEYQFFFEEVRDADNNADNGEFVYTIGIGFLF